MPHNQPENSLLGIKIGPSTLNGLIETVNNNISKDIKDDPFVFACANPHSLAVAQKDRAFNEALNNSSATVADGVGVTLISQLLKINTGPRITGHDFFEAVMDLLNENNGSVFFFGSSESVLSIISSKLKQKYPNIKLAGTLSPPFREWSDEENTEMINTINASNPDVLWVGMTAPKQEKWIDANRNQLKVCTIGAIGAVFDFFADTYPRAPRCATKLGLEWLFRLIKEPKRMWKRNFVSTPLFLFYCFIQHVLLRK